MAPRTKAVAFICNSCKSSFVRGYSSTAPLGRTFPSFKPTSQPELDTLLSQYRETLFIPENLSKNHQHLIYRPSKHHILTNDPGVTVSITDEEDVKLRPMSYAERPEKRKSLARLTSLLGETPDPDSWSNLLPFLEGMKSSHEPVPAKFLEKLTRKANKLGMQRFIIELAEQAKRTDVRLSEPFLLRELLLGCHRRALESSYQGEGFEKAARQAQLIVYMLQKGDHCNKTNYAQGHLDMRRSLFPSAIMLDMTAARAFYSSSKPTDTDGEVSRAVAKVLALSKSSESGLTSLSMPEFSRQKSRTDNQHTNLGEAQERLENLLPVWSGLKFASKIPGAVIMMSRDDFHRLLKHAGSEVRAAEAEVKALAGDNMDRRSLVLLEQLRQIHS
ncbi:uncharacterized protein HMPREF1541_01679 [Cyphellophora europaea CBS 101466]|uniref:Uncharacterized protein n=1 Tax=Cyphellophora europaea (strain CBS 101466) TaxID=1220924 RepID=W2S1G7_CYPE1|nr:uncharacterized protein HMPREF1541_01679 [Cyphellophora europaea CBS 101466]ETN42522.1 hypothetical protein HMPREF1541_01679 [Cyphellophora europaea CBS 101466]